MKKLLTKKINVLTGGCTGLWGDSSGLEGNLDSCELTNTERERGIDIQELISS